MIGLAQVPNHVCQICGKEYYACNKCRKYNGYKLVVDKPDCYGVYLILTDYRQGVITKKEAEKKLRDNNITLTSLKKNKDNYIPEVYDKLVEVMTFAKDK